MCQPLWFLFLAWCMGSRQAPFSSFSLTGMLGPHCAQFGKEEQGPWQHCFLRLHFLATALAGFHGTGDKVLCLPQSRLGHGYGSKAKMFEERGRILLQWELTRNSRRKQAGSGTQRTAFSILISTSSHFYLKLKKMFPKILNFYCKDLLQRMWELFSIAISSWNSVCHFPPGGQPGRRHLQGCWCTLNTFSVLVVLLVKSRWLCCLRSRYNLFVPSERIFVLFCRSGSMCNCCCCIALFYPTRQCLKGSMLWGLHFTSFCITKGKYQSTFIHQHPQVHHEFWNL